MLDEVTMEFPFNPHNLPMMLVEHDCPTIMTGLARHYLELLTNPNTMQSFLSVLHQTNQNITSLQKELLLWHQRLGHAGFQWNQAFMMNQEDNGPVILTKHATTGRSQTENLVCTACSMSKAGQCHQACEQEPPNLKILCCSPEI